MLFPKSIVYTHAFRPSHMPGSRSCNVPVLFMAYSVNVNIMLDSNMNTIVNKKKKRKNFSLKFTIGGNRGLTNGTLVDPPGLQFSLAGLLKKVSCSCE